MNRKFIRFTLYSLLLLLATANIKLFAQEDNISYFRVDTNRSYVRWEGKKLLGSHHGRLLLNESEIEMKNGKISAGEFSVRMDSITCLDIEDPKLNQQLINHLKRPDFFGVEQFPVSNLKIKMSIPNPTAKKGQPNYTIIADLKIKDSTHTITFPAEIRLTDKEMKATSEFNFDRTKYDIKFNSLKFFPDIGDKMIDDMVNLQITLYLIRVN